MARYKNIAQRLQRNLTETVLSGAKIIEQIPMDTEAVHYEKLADWCQWRRRTGQVCEAAGADWLPFQTFAIVDSSHRP